TVFARASAADSILTVDTVYTEWKGARAGGSGTLGWSRPHTGTMAFTLAADSLVAFDSLLLAVTGQSRDTLGARQPLDGQGTAALTLTGSLDTLQVLGSFDARNLVFQSYRSPRITGTFSSTGGAVPQFGLMLEGDSLLVLGDSASPRGWTFADIGFAAEGRTDPPDWLLGTLVGVRSRIDGTGSWLRRDSVSVLGVDSLLARLGTGSWRLAAPTTLAIPDSGVPLLDSTRLLATDGSGGIRASGRIPLDG